MIAYFIMQQDDLIFFAFCSIIYKYAKRYNWFKYRSEQPAKPQSDGGDLMCTAVTYKTKDFYLGRTLDYEFSYGDEVIITPRNY